MIKTTLRLPDELHQAVKELAKKEHRSFHAQVVYILEKYIEQLKEKKQG